MKVKNDLFDLIQGMTPAEKRYFKIYIGNNAQAGDSNYKLLFDLIEKQKSPDDAAIKKQLGTRTMSAQLSVSKHHLYNHVLKSLQLFHYGKSAQQILLNHLEQIELLYDRQLFSQCGVLVDKAIKVATRYEKHNYLQEALQWQVMLTMKNLKAKDINETLTGLYARQKEIHALATQTSYLSLLDNQMLVLIKKHGLIRTEKDAQPFEQIITDDALRSLKALPLFTQQYYYHHIFALYEYMKGDNEKSHYHRECMLDLFATRPEMAEEMKHWYISALNNFILTCQQLKKEKEFIETLGKLRAVQPSSAEEARQIFINSYTQEMLYYYYQFNFKKVLKLAPAIDDFLDQNDGKTDFPNVILFKFIFACSYTQAKDYTRALHYVNDIVNNKDSEQIQDIYRFSRIIQLLIHFELGNYSLLKSLVPSTMRILKIKNRLFQTETIMLELFSKVIAAPIKTNSKTYLQAASDKLETLFEDPYENRAQSYFDFKGWLQSKL